VKGCHFALLDRKRKPQLDKGKEGQQEMGYERNKERVEKRQVVWKCFLYGFSFS